MNAALVKAKVDGRDAFRSGLNHRANPHDDRADLLTHLAWFNGWLVAAIEKDIGEKFLVTDQPDFGDAAPTACELKGECEVCQ